ncbi:MAG: GNAT family N-acetyltransferase [Janthinobacterium lividum]
MATTIERATPLDIPELMRLERGEGFERLVGRWSQEQHAAEMAKQGSRFLAARSEAGLAGFVLLQELDDSNGCATLRRIAVARPGEGLGPRLLAVAQDEAFGLGSVHRLQLRVYPENPRARRAYDRAGFVEEGLMRGVSRQADGSHRSMLLMAILRPEWEARRR